MMNLHRYIVKTLLKRYWRTTMNWTLIRMKSSEGHPTAGIIGNINIYTRVHIYICIYLYKYHAYSIFIEIKL